MDAQDWRRCVRISIAEGALAAAMGTLLSGVFLTGFAMALGASRVQIGLLAALPAVATLLKLVGARLLRAGVNRKRLCLTAVTISRLCWAAMLLVPLIASGHREAAVIALIVLVGVSSMFGSLAGVAWLSWIRDLVPSEKRLGFLGFRNQINTVLALALGVAGAGFLDWWNEAHPNAMGGFFWVLTAAIACGLIAIPILGRLQDPGKPLVAQLAGAAAKAPATTQNFRRLVYFYVAWNLACSLATPFFSVYMLEKLHLPYWHITALYALQSIAGLAATGWWTALSQRIGPRRVVLLATLGEAFFPLCWVFLSAETTWALPLVFMFGIFQAPLAVGAHTLVMRLSPDERASSCLATFNATMGLAMAAAAVLGGWLSTFVTAQAPALGGLELGGLKTVFFLSFLGRFASLGLLNRVVDVEETPLERLGLNLHWLPWKSQPQLSGEAAEPVTIDGLRE
ncbi:MAG: MFS transporter [Pirellulales bacterium]|nr:MFS transporter [Pirellulales bacterium]